VKLATAALFVVCGMGCKQSGHKSEPVTSTAYWKAEYRDPQGLEERASAAGLQLGPASTAGLPAKGSEDAAGLLVRPTAAGTTSDGEYGPDEAIDWVIDLEPRTAASFSRAAVLSAFDEPWKRNHGFVEVFGVAATGRWTYVRASDAPEAFRRLAVAVPLYPDPGDLGARLGAIEKAAHALGAASVTPRRGVASAGQRATALASLADELGRAEATAVLKAGDGKTFDGRAIWDAMLSLGLTWGDMDLFHWDNPSRSVGDDSFFSVSTNTAPGYFLPREIAAGRVHAVDLVFSFSIPRSADPEAVIDAMLAAAEYARRRLGGTLVDRDGARLDPAALRREVRAKAERLRGAGVPPGASAALRLF
jgi:cell division protein ZipA